MKLKSVIFIIFVFNCLSVIANDSLKVLCQNKLLRQKILQKNEIRTILRAYDETLNTYSHASAQLHFQHALYINHKYKNAFIRGKLMSLFGYWAINHIPEIQKKLVLFQHKSKTHKDALASLSALFSSSELEIKGVQIVAEKIANSAALLAKEKETFLKSLSQDEIILLFMKKNTSSPKKYLQVITSNQRLNANILITANRTNIPKSHDEILQKIKKSHQNNSLPISTNISKTNYSKREMILNLVDNIIDNFVENEGVDNFSILSNEIRKIVQNPSVEMQLLVGNKLYQWYKAHDPFLLEWSESYKHESIEVVHAMNAIAFKVSRDLFGMDAKEKINMMKKFEKKLKRYSTIDLFRFNSHIIEKLLTDEHFKIGQAQAEQLELDKKKKDTDFFSSEHLLNESEIPLSTSELLNKKFPKGIPSSFTKIAKLLGINTAIKFYKEVDLSDAYLYHFLKVIDQIEHLTITHLENEFYHVLKIDPQANKWHMGFYNLIIRNLPPKHINISRLFMADLLTSPKIGKFIKKNQRLRKTKKKLAFYFFKEHPSFEENFSKFVEISNSLLMKIPYYYHHFISEEDYLKIIENQFDAFDFLNKHRKIVTNVSNLKTEKNKISSKNPNKRIKKQDISDDQFTMFYETERSLMENEVLLQEIANKNLSLVSGMVYLVETNTPNVFKKFMFSENLIDQLNRAHHTLERKIINTLLQAGKSPLIVKLHDYVDSNVRKLSLKRKTDFRPIGCVRHDGVIEFMEIVPHRDLNDEISNYYCD